MLPTITKLTAGIIFGERNRDADDAPRKGIEGKRFDWRNEAQGVGDRIHGDCTPEPDNPAENELRVGADGNPKKPWVEPRWGTCNEDGSNERLMWNSTDLDDKFSLESWEKKGPQDTSGPGLTPVLLQNEEIGQGRTKCFLYFVISAEHNNGHALDGSDRDACPRVYWMASQLDTSRAVVPGIQGPNGERILRFNDSAIQGHLDAAARRLGDSKVFVEFAVKDPNEGPAVFHFAGGVRFGDHWSATGVFEHSKTDGNMVAGEIRLAV